ncbi:ATP-binding protein [Nocardiopsis algeriensis]|uniref:Anti-sigma regulatory factor (Ser/Thr protein kinase) n=1 Tax=Nocardiopsis algeriensis TaxID=1478215 RepID=A0A841J1A7_9ACTN|nr:ATP-binding protein [Nocardiopsis algeriensis]MBB6122121.1 anti-sigma regulatory factor (Ser/Thr protein kinase) [Nocardiopsis algeriensis]
MPSTTRAPMPELGQATVPLSCFIRSAHRHYFSGRAERPGYRMRHYEFAGTPAVMPLVRAFLDTCAADQSSDYRYLFTLLGSELANNAICHSLSGRPGGSYVLKVERNREGLRLTCRDLGGLCERDVHLAPSPDGLDLGAESGRGLALVDALASEWGYNGNAQYRSVWFHLAYDLAGSSWNTLTTS